MPDIRKAVEDKLNSLWLALNRHNDRYFLKDNPTISDSKYDVIKEDYDLLLKDHPQFKNDQTIINLDIKESTLTTVMLSKKMLSLSKCLNKDMLNKWYVKLPEDSKLIEEYKLDGLSVEVTYESGTLSQILTRGDGYTGEDVTHNGALVSGLPSNVINTAKFKVRGEVFITISSFQKLNEVMDKPYATPRQAAAAILRTFKDNQTVTEPVLSFCGFDYVTDSEFDTYEDMCREMTINTGIVPPPIANKDVIEKDFRSDIYPVDGVVIKVNDHKLREALGNSTEHPNWATAYKFPPLVGTSEIIGCNWFTGKGGGVTPVVTYKPIKIGGVICTKASLHNFGIFSKLGLRIGSTVEISRNGDVIPQIANVTTLGDGESIIHPTLCPACNGLLDEVRGGNGTISIFCINTDGCQAQLLKRLQVFVGKNGFDIKGLGKETLNSLANSDTIKTYSDLFSITKTEWNNCGITGKKLTNILANINGVVGIPTNRFINSLNIPNVGEQLSKNISNYIRSDNDLLEILANYDKLITIPDIGVSTGMEITAHCNRDEFKEEVCKLLNITNLIFITDNSKLTKIAITGSADLVRDEIASLLEPKGYELVDGVTNKVKALLVGANPSILKLSKAVGMGMVIIEIPNPFEINAVLRKLITI